MFTPPPLRLDIEAASQWISESPSPNAVLAGILRRFLHADRWEISGDLLAINDTVDLTATERDTIRAEVGE